MISGRFLLQKTGRIGLGLLATSQLSQFLLPLPSVPQVGHLRMGNAVGHGLADPIVVIGRSSDQRLMGDTEQLAMSCQGMEKSPHRTTDAPADARIDFIEQQGAGAINGRQCGFQSKKKS